MWLFMKNTFDVVSYNNNVFGHIGYYLFVQLI
jgi:hypothetical protein